ncbi:MAG: membrane protein insertion efficiency factor YidD [Candidatus Pacebacteria bacterium]|nr:membrane protein insertion efficiency factor YidD [Candidatus Paceibacterota bacterium]
MSKIIILLIRIYQKTLSHLLVYLGVRCRFYPTCSEYAILSLEKYGLRIGIKKIYHRLYRCRPDNFESCIDFP